VIVLFFTVYCAAGLVGGGKLFETAFGQDYQLGILVTAVMVLAYTVFGGFLAVSLTDFVQGVIMIVALVLMPIVVIAGDGGAGQTLATLRAVDPGLLDLTRGATLLGIVSAVTWGLGYFGQPHIIVRFMAIRSVRDIPTARAIGMIWMAISLLGAIGVGLAGRAYIVGKGLRLDDPERIFIVLSDLLFHPLITGFLFAALLAAIMSTISSQLLVSSSSLTEDCYRLFVRRDASEREAVVVGRVSVVLVALIAALIARDPDSNVLGLVANAWAGFGAAFGPMILLALTWPRMTGSGAVAGLVVGALTVILWIGLGLNRQFIGDQGLYEIVPGFLASLIAIVTVSLATRPDPIAQPAE